jgi:hypothetical protein
VAPGTKREKPSKLANKKCALYAKFCTVASALAMQHAGLVKHAIKQTSLAMRYVHLVHDIGFLEKLDLYGCYQGRRMMHWTVKLQRIRKAAKAREADGSKAGDGSKARDASRARYDFKAGDASNEGDASKAGNAYKEGDATPVQSSILELDLGDSLMEEWTKYLQPLE